MKSLKSFLALVLFLSSFSLVALDITDSVTIVTGTLKGDPASHAPAILASWLERLFQKNITILPENQFDGSSTAIYLGDTAYAHNLNLSAPQLEAEEYAILSDGKNAVITGGYPRGILYGTYDFLETYAGCTKLTVTDDYIPVKTRFSIPDNDLRRRSPYFHIREIRPTCYNEADFSFYSWHKFNNRAHLNAEYVRQYQRTPDNGPGHSLFEYGETFPKDKQDYFSMDASGKRTRATSIVGPGQLCFSNKEMRELVKKEVARRIAADKEACAKNGAEPRLIYNLGHNDNHSYCICPECKKLMAKYGNTFSGALLDFVNEIADAFPDYMFQTFAYQISEKPPQNMKARDNVIIQFAVQCVMNVSPTCDPTRPLTHPFNKSVMDNITAWQKVAKHFAFWHYGRIYAQPFTTPITLIPAIPENFRLFKRIGVNSILSESYYQDGHTPCPLALYDLQHYMTCKYIDNPDWDEHKLIASFLDKYYGPAAPMMQDYLTLLTKAQMSEPTPVCEISAAKRKYLNEDFFTQAYKIMADATAAVKDSPLFLARVEQEYYPLDCTVISKWDDWKGVAPFGITRSQTIDRIERVSDVILPKYLARENRPSMHRSLPQYQEIVKDMILKMRTPIPVPPQFKGQPIRQFSMLDNGCALSNDPDALFGKCVKYPPKKLSPEDDKKWHGKPLEFGVYDYRINGCILSKKFTDGELQQDEKYHLYYMGRSVLEPTFSVFLHWSWNMRLHYTAQQVYNAADSDREYDIYVSIKVTGPAYVKGSNSENAVYMDRVIYIPQGLKKNH